MLQFLSFNAWITAKTTKPTARRRWVYLSEAVSQTIYVSNAKPSGLVVGITGFEPATSSSRTKRATKLRHIPVSRSKRYRITVTHPGPKGQNGSVAGLSQVALKVLGC